MKQVMFLKLVHKKYARGRPIVALLSCCILSDHQSAQLHLQTLNALSEPQLNTTRRPPLYTWHIEHIFSVCYKVKSSWYFIWDVILAVRRECGLFAMGNVVGRQGRVTSRVTDQDRAILVRRINQSMSITHTRTCVCVCVRFVSLHTRVAIESNIL